MDARDAAMRVLATHAERMPDLAPIDPRTDGMDPRDAALAHALIDAALRRWITLGYLIGKAGGRDIRTLEPRMQAALACGAAQLLLMDRIPDHAAIDETVEWAKRRIRPKAGGMVNAILRKVAGLRGERLDAWGCGAGSIPLSDGGALALVGKRLPEDEESRLGIACSLPRGLVNSWARLGADVRDLCLHTLVHPPTVCRVGSADVSGDERFAPHASAGHAVYLGPRDRLAETLREQPGMGVQDAAASEVVDGLHPEGERVLVDLCAGRGTKTRQLLARFPEARIVACEIDADRLMALRAVFAGESRVAVLHVDEAVSRGPAWADLVLTDVPCSNSGVLPRRTEARYRVRSAAMARLIETQRDILSNAARMVRPGGRVVYSTCSLEPEENADQTAWAGGSLGLTVERERAVLPAGGPGDDPAGYRDGSYAAEMRAPAG